MVLNIKTLYNVEQTGAAMREIVKKFYLDLLPYKNTNVLQMYQITNKLPYKKDPQGIEFLARPKFTLQPDFPFCDCDDKTIILCSWAELKGLPWRMVAGARRPGAPLHHVWPEIFLHGANDFLLLDATYPQIYYIGTNGRWSQKKIIATSEAKCR